MPLTPRRKRLLGLYLAAMAASGAVRWLTRPPEPPHGMHSISAHGIRIAYRESGSSAAPPVVLIHGSPGSSAVFEKLMALLGPEFRIIAPDLPGFGYSTHNIAEYSFRAHTQ